jgi:hypothetical protein
MVDGAFHELLKVICAELDAHGLCYALTGSVVSSVYGEPITSQDVDVCLRMTTVQAKALSGSLPPRFYRSEEALTGCAKGAGMANLVDIDTGIKVDLSVLPNEPYSDSVLARRRQVAYGLDGPPFWTVSPEDIVLMKLLWRRESESRKQWDNALSVVRVQGRRLDWQYLHKWAGALGLATDLTALGEAAGI